MRHLPVMILEAVMTHKLFRAQIKDVLVTALWQPGASVPAATAWQTTPPTPGTNACCVQCSSSSELFAKSASVALCACLPTSWSKSTADWADVGISAMALSTTLPGRLYTSGECKTMFLNEQMRLRHKTWKELVWMEGMVKPRQAADLQNVLFIMLYYFISYIRPSKKLIKTANK